MDATRRQNRQGSASPLGLSALQQMLAPAFPGRRTVSAEPLSGGLANASFKVVLSGMNEPVVLRVYVRDPSAAGREAAILQLVKRRVPVPEVVYLSPEAGETRRYAILRWAEGAPLDHLLTPSASAEARDAVRATGRVLARLQEFRFATSGFFGPGLDVATPFASEPGAIIGVVAQCLFQDAGEERLGASLTQRLWRFINEHEDSLGAVEHHAMLVHGDFSGLNVIVQTSAGTLDVSALIDWEYAHSGTPLVDLGSMLRRPGRDLPLWFEDEFIRGYRQEGGVMPDNWRQLSRIVDLVKLCAFVRSPGAGEIAVESARAVIEAALAEEHR